MHKKITMGPYFRYEESRNWMSRDNITEGAVRVIEGELCYATPITLELKEGEYDICSGKSEKTIRVISWEPLIL